MWHCYTIYILFWCDIVIVKYSIYVSIQRRKFRDMCIKCMHVMCDIFCLKLSEKLSQPICHLRFKITRLIQVKILLQILCNTSEIIPNFLDSSTVWWVWQKGWNFDIVEVEYRDLTGPDRQTVELSKIFGWFQKYCKRSEEGV